MMCPIDARTSKPLPRYFSIVFALAGDSTITSDFVIAILITVPDLPCQPCWTRFSQFRFIPQSFRTQPGTGSSCPNPEKTSHKRCTLPRNTAAFPLAIYSWSNQIALSIQNTQLIASAKLNFFHELWEQDKASGRATQTTLTIPIRKQNCGRQTTARISLGPKIKR